MQQIDDHILLKYLNRECSPEELEDVLNFLKESKENEEYLFSLEEIYDFQKLTVLENEPIEEATFEQIYSRVLKEKKGETKKQTKITLYKWCSAVAMIALLIICFTYFNTRYATEPYPVYTVSKGEDSKEIRLKDGTVIWLNPGSTLIVKSWTKSGRNVYLEGEAYFTVAKNQMAPFRVFTDCYTVKVTGTSFLVKSFPFLPKSETILVEGKVVIENRQGNPMIALGVGQKAEFNKESNQLYVQAVENLKNITLRRHNYFVFDKMPMDEIFQDLAIAYNINIILENKLLKYQTVYTGAFKKTNRIEAILEDLKFVFPFNYTYTSEGIQIREE